MAACQENAPLLPPGEVHLWELPGELSPLLVGKILSCLSADESARAQRFYFEKDRRSFSLARGAVRQLLSRYLGVPAASLKFGYSEYGKPFLESPAPSIQFNVSHSYGRALFAFFNPGRVGVDIEYHRPNVDWAALSREILRGDEAACLLELPPEERLRGFFRFWTLKEAFIKAVGKGLSLPLKSFCVRLGGGSSQLSLVEAADLAAEEWTLLSLPLDAPDFCAAIAWEGPGRLVRKSFPLELL